MGTTTAGSTGQPLIFRLPHGVVAGITTKRDLTPQGEDFVATWTPFSPYNVGSVLIQFAVVLAVLLALNKRLARAVQARAAAPSGD